MSHDHFTVIPSINSLLSFTNKLLDKLDANDNNAVALKNTLVKSVIRPLSDLRQNEVLTGAPAQANAGLQDEEDLKSSLDDSLLLLAQQATQLSASQKDIPELIEAAAALQRLVLQNTDEAIVAQRSAAFSSLLSGQQAKIQTAHNGPYLVTNVYDLHDWLGQALPATPLMALCRCGASATKPFCDGSHATSGFTDAKDPKRVTDERDTYVGQQVTIFDNRGICQHSGLCTDRIATVFNLGKDPFITPSGGRMDEIIRAVRDCPSGALSFAIDGVEARNQVDHNNTREPAIEVTKDGPYRTTGAITLVDTTGTDVPRNQGASLEHYALCRCGQSQNKPFCSGMHWYVNFHDPIEATDAEPTIFEWAGGYPAMLRMTRLFYEKYVPEDPILAPVFATMSDDHPERVAKWFSEVFCGPPQYSKAYGGYNRMLSQHINKLLTEEQRARWVMLLSRSATEAMLPNDAEFKSAFGSYIEWGSRLAVENSQTNSQPPQNMPMPHWDWHTAAGAPGSRVSALQPAQDEVAIVYPGTDEQVSFEKHIKQLFRKMDRQSMSFIFDLWKHEDVKKYADEIYRRLENGSMPCDGAWPKEKLDTFSRWKATGMLA